MPENICPVCGMINAEDSTFCWSCKSPLKAPPAPAPSEEGQKSQEASGGKGSKAVPDWLSRIRAKSQMEQEADNLTRSVLPKDESSVGEAGSEAVADWLKELRSDKEQPAEEADQDAAWAGTAAVYTPTDVSEKPAESTLPADEDSEEFLQRLSEWQPKETLKFDDEKSEGLPTPPAAENVPGTPVHEPLAGEEEEKAGTSDLPDWLRKAAQSEEAAPTEAASPVELGRPGGEAVAPAQEETGAPEWLNQAAGPAEHEETKAEPDMPGWLSESAGSTGETTPEAPVETEPAWLSGLGQPAEQSQEVESTGSLPEKPKETAQAKGEEAPDEAPAAPDWLGALKQQFTESEQPGASVGPAEAETPEAAVTEEPVSEEPPPETPKPETTGDAVPDWLNQMRQPLGNEPTGAESEPPSELVGEEPPLESTAEDDNRLQAVLKPTTAELSKPAEPQPVPEVPPAGEPTETSPESSVKLPVETAASPEENEPTADVATTEAAPASEEVEAASDTGQSTESVSPFGGEAAVADGILPDWLNDLARPSEEALAAAEGPARAAREEEAEVSAFFESTPADTMPVKDVMAARQLMGEESVLTPTEETPAESSSMGEEPTPAAAKEPSSTPIKEIPFSSELLEQTPAWLKELESMPAAETPSPETPPPLPADQAPTNQTPTSTPAFQFDSKEDEELLPYEPPLSTEYESELGAAPPVEGSLPAWLEELKPDDNSPQPEASKSEGKAPRPEEPKPKDNPQQPEAPAAATAAFLEENEEPAPAQAMPELEKAKPFSLGGELPDWLSTHWQAEEGQGESSEEKLTMANLPGWVQALRPLDALDLHRFSSEADSRVENKGPLAGYAGVLPGDTLPLNYPRPPLYSAKLNVSERQKVQAALLEQMVKETPAAEEGGSRSEAIAQRLYRMVTGLVLIGILVYSLFFGFKLLPLSSLAPVQTAAVYNALDQLPPDSVVLVGVDFEAGLSGEVKQVALPVVEQLMAQNDHLALISTLVNGPALGNDLLNSANAAVSSYDITQSAVNLGYLPGGTTGLQSFAHDPAETAPTSWQVMQTWPDVSLQSEGSIDQFAAVVVLTDNPETARGWIEQVQPSLNGVPMFMVVSAQAAPLVQPYVASGQVSGMVAGLDEAAAYEQLTQRSGNAVTFLGAYQTGLIVVAALILVGGLLQLLTSLLKNRKADKGA
ncbi:MAG TPA: hypothetical protein VMC62_10720 [Longilinea sp.]|nr:hypothetical protein [Longilinea sp.]